MAAPDPSGYWGRPLQRLSLSTHCREWFLCREPQSSLWMQSPLACLAPENTYCREHWQCIFEPLFFFSVDKLKSPWPSTVLSFNRFSSVQSSSSTSEAMLSTTLKRYATSCDNTLIACFIESSWTFEVLEQNLHGNRNRIMVSHGCPPILAPPKDFAQIIGWERVKSQGRERQQPRCWQPRLLHFL